MIDPTNRRTPPETEDEHALIWKTVRVVEDATPALKALTAIQQNWKLILFGVAMGLAAGGYDLLKAIGVPIP